MVSKEIKTAFKQAISKSMPALQRLSERYKESAFVWTRRSEGGWQGEHVQKTSLGDVFKAAQRDLQINGADFERLFFSAHPEYGEGKLVGYSGLRRLKSRLPIERRLETRHLVSYIRVHPVHPVNPVVKNSLCLCASVAKPLCPFVNFVFFVVK